MWHESFINLIRIEAEKLRRFVHHSLLLFVKWHDVAHFFDIFPEVSFVEFLFEYNFVQCLQLAEGEFLRQEFEADVMALQLVLKCVHCPG